MSQSKTVSTWAQAQVEGHTKTKLKRVLSQDLARDIARLQEPGLTGETRVRPYPAFSTGSLVAHESVPYDWWPRAPRTVIGSPKDTTVHHLFRRGRNYFVATYMNSSLAINHTCRWRKCCKRRTTDHQIIGQTIARPCRLTLSYVPRSISGLGLAWLSTFRQDEAPKAPLRTGSKSSYSVAISGS